MIGHSIPRHLVGAILGLCILAAAPAAKADDGLVAICGNTCVGEEDNGDPLCHWAPATPGQTCQAKGLCSPSECTLWWTAQIPSADAFSMTPAQAKRLPGARVVRQLPGQTVPALQRRMQLK